MASHKYEIGLEDGNCLYRIKCVDENVERVVKEADLATQTTAQ